MDFRRRFPPWTDGIAGRDTLNDSINALNPKLFSECFIAWVNGLRDGTPDLVAIGGGYVPPHFGYRGGIGLIVLIVLLLR
jgi:hypothetical protein